MSESTAIRAKVAPFRAVCTAAHDEGHAALVAGTATLVAGSAAVTGSV
jgi:hypothetical protein